MIQYFPIVTGSLTVLGNINVSGSITTSGSITISGSITSASFASTASYWSGSIVNAESASFASTASFVALAQSASNAVSAVTASFANAFTVAGNLTAQTLVVQTITSSVDFVTGSTRFGSLSSNTHVFSGSVTMNPGGLFVTSSGNVGIGTSSPFEIADKNLSVNGSSSAIQLGVAGVRNAQFYADGAEVRLYAVTNVPLRFGTNDTERMRLDISGNLGLGVTPSAWYTGYTALQVGESAALFSNRTSADTRTTQLANNAYLNSGATNWIYAQTDEATRYEQVNGEHNFYSVVSGSAGGNITWGTSKMTINSTGNVGIGTSTPQTLITGTFKFLDISNIGSSQTSGLTMHAQTGGQEFSIHHTNGVYIDILGHSTASNNFIQFRTTNTNSSYSSYIDAMRITSAGNVGISTTPVTTAGNTKTLQIGGSTIMQSVVNDQTCFSDNAYYDGTSVWKYITANKAAGIRVGAAAAGDITFHTAGTGTVGGTITAWDSTGIKMTITNGGNIGAPNGTNIYNASDIRLKQNITTITNGLDKISALNPVKFNWVDGFEPSEDGKDMLGFIAQEVQDIIPEAVENFGKEGNIVEIDNLKVTNPLRVNEKFIIPVLAKAIQELNTKFEEYKATHP